jgi:serralysin
VWGGSGRDTIDFRNAPVGINVNLKFSQFLDGTLTGVIGYMVREVEDVYGSGFDDTITGTGRPNHLYGFGGADHIMGLGGDDFLYGGDGDDWLAGGADYDTLDGGDGWDACWQQEATGIDCEN